MIFLGKSTEEVHKIMLEYANGIGNHKRSDVESLFKLWFAQTIFLPKLKDRLTTWCLLFIKEQKKFPHVPIDTPRFSQFGKKGEFFAESRGGNEDDWHLYCTVNNNISFDIEMTEGEAEVIDDAESLFYNILWLTYKQVRSDYIKRFNINPI